MGKLWLQIFNYIILYCSFCVYGFNLGTSRRLSWSRRASLMNTPSTDQGLNANQMGLMESDLCISVNENDEPVSPVSKKDSHIFSKAAPRGKLHRAFSVFLFNSENKLLLQQRAADKITFPEVWTNTCCSHPLVGMIPEEVDSHADILQGQVDGIKRAAVRKLANELNIAAEDVPVENFRYLTRLHYWAADVATHGPESPWGEHEIDYLLFIKLGRRAMETNFMVPNPEEVMDTRWVDWATLQDMMKPEVGLRWSPWFRILVETPALLERWWGDLDAAIATDKYADYTTIHRFDPDREHMGGAGGASEWLGSLKVEE